MTTADTFALRPAPSAALDPEAFEDLGRDPDYARWCDDRDADAIGYMEAALERAASDASEYRRAG